MVAGPFSRFVEQEFHRGVPRTHKENLVYRRNIIQACRNKENRAAIQYAAQNDILFWLNTFCWVHEPRGPYILPFCTWEFQDEAIAEIVSSIGVSDVGIEKSRDMGITWIGMAITTFFFQFVDDVAIGCMSRNEDLSCALNTPKSLFWKINFLLKHQPRWLMPKYEFNTGNNLIKNQTNSSTITGSSTTKDSLRGERYLFVFMDEAASFDLSAGYDVWASTQSTANTRIAVSTPQGQVGIFADIMRNNRNLTRITKVSLHWTKHPLKRRGLYTSELGRVRFMDLDYTFPPDYKFVTDGKTRSPWYDKECERNPSKRHIAQELDLDYGGSGSPFFDYDVIADHARKYAKPPVHRFNLDWDESSKLQLIPHAKGTFLVWYANMDGDPPHDSDYVIGCDIATGRGGDEGSNSVLSIANLTTGEKMAELADNTIYPDQLAHLAIALRSLFTGPTGDAWLIWEVNGPGTVFGNEIIRRSPHKLYLRRSEKKLRRMRTQEPGWASTKAEKSLLLSSYQQSLRTGRFINHHSIALEECKHYVLDSRGCIVHDHSLVADDPNQVGDNHGDRVIADALCAKLIGDRPIPKANPQSDVERVRTTDISTFAGRYAKFQRRLEIKERW